jgi:hydrogenase maturation protease
VRAGAADDARSSGLEPGADAGVTPPLRPPAVREAPPGDAAGESGAPRARRVVVGCVGNVLRRDDGFGPAVGARLGPMPQGVEVIESGIGGVALLQELMAGCYGLVLVDAVDQGAPPGTVFVITPEVGEAVHVPDVHLANPDRVLSMAKGLGVLPERVAIVGCQPVDASELGEGLSPEVERAVATAAVKVKEIVNGWL